ncbi:MAG: hypothetical protein Q7S53_02170 [bacterium]|nr:hypothetical protein [bacterium]
MTAESWGIYSFLVDKMSSKSWAILSLVMFLFVLACFIWETYFSEAKKTKPALDDKRLFEIFKEQDEQRARATEKSRIRSEERNRVFEKESRKERRKKLISSSKKLLEQEIPKSMDKTRGWISNAERYYESHTYDPFWNALEQGAISLDNLKKWVNHLTYYMGQLNSLGGYSELSTQVEREFLEFQNLCNRLNDLMGKGHSSSHFANIYQQRVTRNVLVAGFTSLDIAINTLGREIHNNFHVVFSALSEVSNDVSSGLSEIKDRETRSTLALEKTKHAVDDMSRDLAS